MSRIKRWFEGLSYLPGYYRLFFLYIAIILLVFIYSFLQTRGFDAGEIIFLFIQAGLTIGYSGIFFPIFIQNLVAKLSRRIGWWIATIGSLVGFYLFLRILVVLEFLDVGWRGISGIVYMINFYGIIWAGIIALAGVVNVARNHGLSGLKRNIKRDVKEISTINRMTKGEPLILDKRTAVLIILGLIFSGAILAFRYYYVKRPDRITDYQYPRELSPGEAKPFSVMLVNDVPREVERVDIEFTGYFRYPAFTNYSGEDLLELAKTLPIVEKAYQRASEAPGDMITVEEDSGLAENEKQVSLDFSEAYEHLGLYSNRTSHLLIPSKFIVKWDKRDKKLRGVWVGTPGIPFMDFHNGTKMDGNGVINSSRPYEELIDFGRLEFQNLKPDLKYGFNMSAVLHPWLKGEFQDIDQFLIKGRVIVPEEEKTRNLIEVELSRSS